MSSSSTNSAILNHLWARDTKTKRVVSRLLSTKESNKPRFIHFVGKKIVLQNENSLWSCVFESSFWLVFIAFLLCRQQSALWYIMRALLSNYSADSCQRFRGFWTWRSADKIRIWRCCSKLYVVIYFMLRFIFLSVRISISKYIVVA